MGLGCPQCGTLNTDNHAPGCTWKADHPLVGQIIVYEYAGFQYSVKDMGGRDVTLTPIPGQHSASAKDRHIRAAREQYMEDANARPASLRSKP